MGQFEDMALFARIVETGSITATAEHMNIAKSAVSRRLMELEERLGTQLLNRTTRKSSLTDAGQLFYQKSARILSDVDDLTNSVTQGSDELQGTLKVALPLTFGVMHLAPAINEFSMRHPKLLMDIDFADGQVDVVKDGFDLAIRIADLADSSMIARKLTTIRHTLCASPEYLEKRGIPKTPSDLKGHDILRYKSSSGLTHHIFDNEGNSHEVKGKVVTISNNGDYLRQAALAGRGMYFTPTFITWKELRSGTLVSVLPDYKYLTLGAYAIYPPTRFLSERVRKFIDFLGEYLGKDPYWE